ncbi:MAG TPA: transposase [Anaerolineales bacterium]|jgi:transposase-like protein
MAKSTKPYPPDIKLKAVLDALTGEKTIEQIAKHYQVHPNSVLLWKRQLIERGEDIFRQDSTAREYERRIADLERLLGKKEVEIALLKNFLSQDG